MATVLTQSEAKLGDWVHRKIQNIDPDLAPFWQGFNEHEFKLCRCSRCGSWWFPYAVCDRHPEIPDFDVMEWVPSSGRGTIFAMLVINQVVDMAFAGEVPYAITIVALDEGPHFPARIIGDPSQVAIGSPVEVVFLDSAESGQTLPLFRLRQDAA
ncbi:Zn-ribbon domain-containing OB-fold protein [Streptomyces sp. NPDC096311]|uniref:Zn-ribbon domain-containing OB-fold protein n=1 Tax=Streptomyces sp. NPDC096311 TaxID=3366083 RepID=UPI00380182BF